MSPIIMAYFEPLTDVLIENWYQKHIVHPLNKPLHTYNFLVAAQFGKKRAFHTGINRENIDDKP